MVGDRYRPGEDLFYAALARLQGGPVLEPACGSGRLLLALRAQGLPVWGADASAAMLRLARQRLRAQTAAEPGLAGVPYRLLRQTLQDLASPGPCRLLLLPLEAFRLLRDPAEQTAFLARARDLLAPGGRLALDLTLPTAPLPPPVVLDRVPTPAGGWLRGTVRWLIDGADLVEETVYEVTGPRGRVRHEACRDRYRLVSAGELADLLRRTGWQVEQRWADFQRTPYHPSDPRLVVVARREGEPAGEANRRRT